MSKTVELNTKGKITIDADYWDIIRINGKNIADIVNDHFLPENHPLDGSCEFGKFELILKKI